MAKLKKLSGREDIRKQILEAEDVLTREVEVPEWGLVVIVRGMTGAQRDAWEESNLRKVGKGEYEPNLRNMRAKLVALCVVDEAGKRVFSDADAQALGEKSGKALSRVSRVVQELSGISEEDLEDLAKNSGSGQSGDLPSG